MKAPLLSLSLLLCAELLVLGCSSAASASAAPAGGVHSVALPREELLERGGELQGERPERALRVTAEWVSVWGISEVPDGSRLQLALSGVDAITRAELLKAVRVRVTSVLTDVESSDPRRRVLELETTERVTGVIASAGPLPHGWARLRRGKEVVLRLWARLDVRRAALEAALRSSLASAGGDTSVFVGGLTLSEGPTP